MLFVLSLLACGGGTTPEPDTANTASDPFCSELSEGGVIQQEEGGATGASGRVFVRVITTESADPRDPLYVAFKDYAMENVVTGGVATTGKTSGDGIVEEVLGEGTWSFRAAYPRGSRVCTATLELPVVAGQTTRGCAVMTCPS